MRGERGFGSGGGPPGRGNGIGGGSDEGTTGEVGGVVWTDGVGVAVVSGV